jgi:hypothetical protein
VFANEGDEENTIKELEAAGCKLIEWIDIGVESEVDA